MMRADMNLNRVSQGGQQNNEIPKHAVGSVEFELGNKS